mgnify:CR=1 FL=1
MKLGYQKLVAEYSLRNHDIKYVYRLVVDIKL